MEKNLKSVNKEKNPGLAKLPEKVRNRMGYAQKGKMMKAKTGVMAKEDNLSKYVREVKEEKKPKGAKRLSDKVMKKNMGGEAKGFGAARTSGMGLQDEQLVPGKSLDYYKDLM
jgi:hypothetical protein